MIISSLLGTYAAQALGVTGTITVGTYPGSIAYDSGKGEIFVATSTGISIISDDNNTVAGTVTSLGSPYSLAYDSGKGEVFATFPGPNLVAVISDRNNTVVATIPVQDPVHMAYDSGKSEIFVSNLTAILVISDSNNTVVATIPTGGGGDLTYDSGKGEIFADNFIPIAAASETVEVIADSNNSIVGTVYIGGMIQLEGITYDSGKSEIFLATTADTGNTVDVISDSNYTLITNSNFLPLWEYGAVIATVKIGGNPSGIVYDSGKSEIFVVNYGDNSVSVISDSNNTIVATVPVGYGPQDIAYDSGKNELFVTNDLSKNQSQPLNLSPGNTISVISDAYPLAATSITPLPSALNQGQTSHLASSVTTGLPPYKYQWLNQAPNASSYASIAGANLSTYNFTTSTLTATGNWSFILQVTDATGAAVNSTAIMVTVNAYSPAASSSQSQSAFSTRLIAALLVVAVFAIAALLLLYKLYEKKKKVALAG